MNKKYMIRTFSILLTVIMLFSLTGCGSQASSKNTAAPSAPKLTDKAMAGYYVDAEWLRPNLKDVVVIDARAEKEYKSGHVPGAINITWQALSNMQPKQGEPGWGVVLGADELGKKLGSFGIDGKKMVVIYNDPAGMGEEGRVLWMLRLAGIDNSRMLFGGWPVWKLAGGEVSKGIPTITPVNFTITQPDNSLLATTDYIKANKSTIKLVDTRSPEEFNGKTNHGEKALGYIPGAIHIHYRDAYNADGTVKTPAELKAMFEKAGLKPGDDIVTYCTVGIRSGFMAEMLRMAGFDKAKNYNGSFSEWAGDPTNPIAK